MNDRPNAKTKSRFVRTRDFVGVPTESGLRWALLIFQSDGMNMSNKRVFWFVVGGAVLGSAMASWLAPKGIAWYFDPPVNVGINCRSATEWAMAKLQIMQAVGLGVGGLLGLLIGMNRRQKHAHGDDLPSEPTL